MSQLRWTLLCLVLPSFACSLSGDATKWEYKVVAFSNGGESRTGADAMKFTSVTPDEAELNALGLQGWELSASYLESETAYPNFGNDSYVTGLQPNVRPQRWVAVFKREKP